MNIHSHFDKYTAKMNKNPGADESLINDAQSELGFSLPDDYLDFLRSTNGVQGLVGSNYVVIWPIEKLAQYNAGYQVAEFAPGLLLFGSDGSGNAYAFDTRHESFSIVEVPFIGMGLEGANVVATSFSEFLEKMYLEGGTY